MKKIGFFILFLLALRINSYAVNFYDGIHASDNLYVLSYSTYYQADKITDNSGKSAQSNYGYDMGYELVRIAWYQSNLVLTGLISAGGVYISSIPQGSFGLGDILLGCGYFIPVKFADILPMLFVKFPTGQFDNDKSVNFGSNQADIRPMLFINKIIDTVMLDVVAKYNVRMKDHDRNKSYADELYLEGVAGYRIQQMYFGPSIKWKKNINQKPDGTHVDSPKKQAVSLGCDFLFPLGGTNVTFSYMYDIYAQNSLQGHFYQVKVVYKAF